MKLDRLCVDAIGEDPAFVVVRAEPQLFLRVRRHLSVDHPEAAVFPAVNGAGKRLFETGPRDRVVPFGHALRVEFGFTAPHVAAFGAQGDHAIALAFELEEPRRAAAVFIPRQPVLFFGLEFRSQSRAYEGFEAGARQRHVAAVRVHLEQLVVAPVHVPVEEVVVELEHAQLGQLVDRDADLVRTVDRHALFSRRQLVGRSDLVEVFEIRAAQHSVDQLLVLRVPRRVVVRHVLDHLAVARVSEEFEL